MKRFCIGRDGRVVNIVAAQRGEDIHVPADHEIFEDNTGTAAVGDAYDPKDVRLDRADLAIHEILFRVVNDVRGLKGQAALGRQQYRDFVKSLMT